MDRSFYIYILTNFTNTVLYTGFTNDLTCRLQEHKERINPQSFTARYNIYKLVYYEHFEDAYTAIVREKQIKSGSRKKKIILIESINKEWKDLSDGLF
jgi:putative endonuclease